MDLVAGQTITNEWVTVDGKHFRDCTLVNCMLRYNGDAVTFERTHLLGCRHVFYGKARQTVQYLQSVGILMHDPGEWGEFGDVSDLPN